MQIHRCQKTVPEVPVRTPLGLLQARHCHQTPIPEACKARERLSAHWDPLRVFFLRDTPHRPDMASKPLCLQLREGRWSTYSHIAIWCQCQTLNRRRPSFSLSPELDPATSSLWPSERGDKTGTGMCYLKQKEGFHTWASIPAFRVEKEGLGACLARGDHALEGDTGEISLL